LIKIRNLVLGEELPEKLKTGFEVGACDPKWIWIAEHAGKPCGILVTAPCHVLVIFVRLIATEDAPPATVLILLGEAAKEMAMRGYMGYATWLNPMLPEESALLAIIKNFGGVQMQDVQVACAGKLVDRRMVN
jgi:hypothetical protein